MFQVIAREVRTAELFSSTADITVNIRDINDNNPQFTTTTHKTTVTETYQQPDSITTIVVSIIWFPAKKHTTIAVCIDSFPVNNQTQSSLLL